jgi:hypothetical protein
MYPPQRPKDKSPTMKLLITDRQTFNKTAMFRNLYVITTELFEYLVIIYRILIMIK